MTVRAHRLWGRLADYELRSSREPGPKGAGDVSSRRTVVSVRRLIDRIVAEYPGNRIVLASAVHRRLAVADEDLAQTVARMLASQHYVLWELPHARNVAQPRPIAQKPTESSRDAEDAKPDRTWIEAGVVDQMGRPLPWMRAWLTLPGGSRNERTLDADARTREDGLEQAGQCVFEVRARPGARREAQPQAAHDGKVGVAEPAWIELRIVDQYGRPVTWLRARTAAADGSVLLRPVDAKTGVRLYPLPPAERCTVEVLGTGAPVEVAS